MKRPRAARRWIRGSLAKVTAFSNVLIAVATTRKRKATLNMSYFRLQILACTLGVAAGLVPSVSFTSTFWEMSLSQFGEGPVRINRVVSGSPADQAGLRTGDAFRHVRGFDGVIEDLRELKPGERRGFTIIRHESESEVELTGVKPAVAAVYYASAWYPVAGTAFLALSLCLIATSPLSPVPSLRSVSMILAGLALAFGFAAALVGNAPFTRVLLWQRWLMGMGEEWTCGQGFAGLVAGLALALTATAELRARLTRQQLAQSAQSGAKPT